MNYLDFELEIGPGSGREYPVAVVQSPAGEAREVMRFPFDKLALENHLKDLQIALLRSGGTHRVAPSSEEETVQVFGKEMFNALLTGEVRNRYDISREKAKRLENGLRLKLRIQPPELAALPWEFLYDPREAEYVSLSVTTPVVRYLELPRSIELLTITPPLRILGMIASPSDLPPLGVHRERQRVEQATGHLRASGLLDLTWLEGQTWRDLQRAMRGGPWHVFHFIGHGGFDKTADEGLIALANEEGETYRLGATQLGRLLADHPYLRLALLNACEGARGSGHDIFSSTAAILVRRGIPAVLAMQYEITDPAAIEFARSFYEAVTDGLPVDAAVAEARKAIKMAVKNTMEWGTPVLYMRSPDGVLFNIQPQTVIARQPSEAVEGLEPVRQEVLARDAERAERERRAREKEEADRLAALKAEEERIANEKAEHERLAREKAEAERLAAQKAETEQIVPVKTGQNWLGLLLALVTVLVVVLLTVRALLPIQTPPKPTSETSTLAATQTAPIVAATLTTAPQFTSTPLPGANAISPIDGMVQVFVPAGEFLMGSTNSDPDAGSDEQPQHTIYLDAYWIDRTEVSVGQYRWCAADGPCRPPRDRASLTRTDYYDDPVYDTYPVIWVDWSDATDYCSWAGRRLPTEAEWEKAARGPDGRLYPWGNNPPSGPLANLCDRNCRYEWRDDGIDDGFGDTAPVGSYPAGGSPYGALGMAGNVWEWVADFYDPNYYSASPDRNPTGPSSGSTHNMRSGSFQNVAAFLRSAVRNRDTLIPENLYHVGFRCAQSAP